MERTVNTSSPVERSGRILIAGIGNIFLGDDGFGVAVAQRLLQRKEKQYPPGVEVVDFGIRGLDLAYTLLADYAALLLVDAIPRGGSPGTLYVIEPDLAGVDAEQGAQAGQAGLAAHSMDPVKVLAFARTLGARPIRTLLVGCEPAPLGAGDAMEMQMELSAPVAAAVDEAVRIIDTLVDKLLHEKGILLCSD
ncbi:MAG TPA: hydrogenase maturation protease [Ktedonobacteraceae bacterium]|jgi:hydrogenase maturation protease|nr:hydrogenase maturation protease [Ktedonobacteraceae bacterium]